MPKTSDPSERRKRSGLGTSPDYPFSFFDLLKFKQHFGISDEDEDTEMYCEYIVGPMDAEFLSLYLDEAVGFDSWNLLISFRVSVWMNRRHHVPRTRPNNSFNRSANSVAFIRET
jgi:hypothetical protein